MKKHAKSFSTLIGFCVVVFLFSCKKEDDAPRVFTKCQPQTATKWRGNHEKLSTKQLSYDENGRLIRVVSGSGSGDVANIHYDQEGRIYQLTNDNGFAFEKRHYNNAGQLIKISHFADLLLPTGPWPTYERILTYNSVGQLREMRTQSNASSNTDSSYTLYTYNATGQVATDSLFKIVDGIASFNNSNEYAYDDKIGLAAYDLESNLLDNEPYQFFPLKHNIISQKRTWNNGNITTATMQYQYNEIGYPIKRELYSNGELLSTTDFNYSCF